MKKYFLVLINILLLAIPGSAMFMMQLSDNSIDFGLVNIGESKFGIPADNLKITCVSDQGNRWTLQIKANNDLTSGQYLIPIKNLKWFGTYAKSLDGSYLYDNERSFSRDNATSLQLYDSIFYQSDNTGDQVVSSGSSVYLQFGITVPDTQPRGTYLTTVVITMTE